MDWSFIDKVVYINLERSVNRNERMKEVIKPFGNKVIRFNAIDVPEKGHYGCSSSHIAVLEMAIKNRWENVLILEDDIEWNHNKISYDNLKSILTTTPQWNVILFGGVYVVADVNTFRLSQSCSTASYLVNKFYYKRLLQNFKAGNQLLQKKYCNSYYIDTVWWILMKTDYWYIIFPNIFYQRKGISVIENSEINRESNFFTNENIIKVPIKKAFWDLSDVTHVINSLKPNKCYKVDNLIFSMDGHELIVENQVRIKEGNYFLIINENISDMEI